MSSTPPVPALFVDLYELTMVQAYIEEGMTGRAAFSLYVRDFPPARRFLVAAGLDDALAYLETLRFSEDDVAHLDSLGRFSPRFLDWMRAFEFSGDVHAMPEGAVCFANEPLLEVEAPIAEAQLVETLLLNQLTVQTLLTSKAVRVVLAAQGRPVVDFGTRRSHGSDAALKAARCLHIAGFSGTSNVEAGRRYGIPVVGTMAHSYIQAHADERDAFRRFARQFPGTTLLVDTYDTLHGVRHAIEVILDPEIGPNVAAIRLDSGDFASLARSARAMLDDAGLQRVQIVASGGLDEYEIARLLEAHAPIDSFAVGTRVNVSPDAPALETVYKLVAYEGEGRRKISPDKETLPHRKQVFRTVENGVAAGDVIARHDELLPGIPLLRPVMRGGRRLEAGSEDLETIRTRMRDQVAGLPAHLATIDPGGEPYPVAISPALASEMAAGAG